MREVTDEAVTLGLALQLFEDGLCSCGHPFRDTSDDLMSEWISIETRICQVCAHIESKRETENKPAAGSKTFARRLFSFEFKPSRRYKEKFGGA